MTVTPLAPSHLNVAVLRGVLSRDPQLRTLPSGDRVGAFEVTVRQEGAATDTVPVSWVGVPERALRLVAGTEVVVVGRVRRRFFRTPVGTGSRTELAAATVVRATQRTRVAGAIDEVVARLSAEDLPAR